VFYGGYGHVSKPNAEWPKGGRICMVRSNDEGRTWTKPGILYDSDVDDRDPHIAQLKDGTLICSFFTYPAGGVEIDYQTPNPAPVQTLRLPAAALRDNDGQALLANKEARLTSPNDLYQSARYTEETKWFKPRLDYYDGNLCLVAHKVDRYKIKRPAGIDIPPGGTVKVYPSGSDLAAQIDGQWVPITRQEPFPADGMIDLTLGVS
jgi:hypothetical protein